MASEAEQFAEVVRRFCIRAEGERHPLLEARQFLISLLLPIPHLSEKRNCDSLEENFARRGYEGWKEDYQRFSDLPFQKYRMVFDPFSDEEVIDGVLSDDFADIYGDLWHGLQAYEAGHQEEAFSIWIGSYFFHWGRHACSALNAIDAFYRENADDG